MKNSLNQKINLLHKYHKFNKKTLKIDFLGVKKDFTCKLPVFINLNKGDI